MVKSRNIGDGRPPTFNRNPYNGYINPYYWVDDHPLLYGNNGSLDPGTFILPRVWFINNSIRDTLQLDREISDKSPPTTTGPERLEKGDRISGFITPVMAYENIPI